MRLETQSRFRLKETSEGSNLWLIAGSILDLLVLVSTTAWYLLLPSFTYTERLLYNSVSPTAPTNEANTLSM